MKKIFLTAIALGFVVAGTIRAQSSDLNLTNDQKNLKEERTVIGVQEKTIRKEERAIRRSEVSYQTKEQFQSDFPEAVDPVFHRGHTFEEVFYTLNGQSFIAYYDNDSQLVGTTTEKEMNDLPPSAEQKIEKRYLAKGYSVNRVILFDDNEYSDTDMWLYDRPFNDQDIYFVELNKAGETLILQVDMNGDVGFFKKL